MSAIISAETIVRNGIRERLKDYVPRINAKIQATESAGEHSITLNEKIPDDVKAAYEQAGYDVRDGYNNEATISWQTKYDEIVGDEEEMAALTREATNGGPNDEQGFFDKI